LSKFDGNILKWQEFWDSFQSAIHQNKGLNPVDKMNYLKAQLEGDAEAAISGLGMTNDNYPVALDLLEKRFGNKQFIINSHYRELMNLPGASHETTNLRCTVDAIEKHLRSLVVLHENINNSQTVALIQSKLPRDVMLKLQDGKLPGVPWSVEMLCGQLHHIISNREMVDMQYSEQRDDIKE
jgi:hypothetical protein